MKDAMLVQLDIEYLVVSGSHAISGGSTKTPPPLELL